jgi:hypothetical protein
LRDAESRIVWLKSIGGISGLDGAISCNVLR